MKTIYAIETNPTLDIGRQGENGVTQVLFPKFADFNEAHAIYKRQGDTGYTDITLLSFDDDYYVWTIGTFHTQKAGWGKVEVNYSNNGIKQKTITWDVRVHKSLEATSTPEGYVDGNAIHIDTGDRSINLLFDDEYFSLTDGNELTLNSGTVNNVFIATRGTTTYNEVLEAYNAGKVIICKTTGATEYTIPLSTYYQGVFTFTTDKYYNSQYNFIRTSLSSTGWTAISSIFNVVSNGATGANNKPVYVNADGLVAQGAYELNKTVPSDAVFTDTTYTAGTGISITDGVISLNLPTITDQTTY